MNGDMLMERISQPEEHRITHHPCADLGKVVYLNGTSSSGKSTIAAALQDLMEEPFLHLSVDTILAGLPDRVFEPAARACFYRAITGFHRCIPAFSGAGVNVIVDDVLDVPAWLDEVVDLLMDYPVLFVGVHCSPEELDRRERERGDRDVGLARSQLASTHRNALYDVEVDTSTTTALDCAERIRAAFPIATLDNAVHRMQASRSVTGT